MLDDDDVVVVVDVAVVVERLKLLRRTPASLLCSLASLSRRARAFLPVRCVTRYSHFVPLLAHRAHCGLSLEHLVLDAAHDWQLSRSRMPVGGGMGGGGKWGNLGGVIEFRLWRGGLSNPTSRFGPRVLCNLLRGMGVVDQIAFGFEDLCLRNEKKKTKGYKDAWSLKYATRFRVFRSLCTCRCMNMGVGFSGGCYCQVGLTAEAALSRSANCSYLSFAKVPCGLIPRRL